MVRFSSESWSGIFLLVALALIYSKSNKSINYFLIGTSLGISFLCRYQIAFAVVPIFLYLIPEFYKNKTSLLSWLLGFTTMVMCGIAIDCWYYGNFVLTGWNYFYVNIIENAAANFGEQGPWFYLNSIIFQPTWPLGIALLIAFVVLLVKQPKNLLCWIVIMFVLSHSVIGHKEERFLFPLAMLFGPILIVGWTKLLSLITVSKIRNVVVVSLLVVMIPFNFFGHLVMMSNGAGHARMEITKYLQERGKEVEEIKMYHTSWSNPFNPWGSVPMKFYQEAKVEGIQVKNMEELRQIEVLNDSSSETYLVIRRIEKSNPELLKAIEQNGFILKKESVPEWLIPVNEAHDYLNLNDVLLLYQKKN
jgi:phosphatidylinositol glycan class B